MGISLKGILGTIAPVLASALPGPLGGIAKKAVAGLLGIKETSTEDEIEKALATASPDTLLKLKQLDADFKLKMEQLGVDLEKLSYDDTASARAMQVAQRSKTPPILSYVVTGGWAALTGFLLFHQVPTENHDIIMRTLGTLDAAVGLVLGFWFGSSSSSRTKDDTIKELSK